MHFILRSSKKGEDMNVFVTAKTTLKLDGFG